MLRKIIGIFFFVSVLACEEKINSIDLNGIAESFSDLECRAIDLRRQRYELADEIRFAQDTLMHAKTDTMRISVKLNQMQIERENLTAKSLELADTIRLQLDSLMKFVLKNPEDKQQFSKVLDSVLIAKGCIDR